MRRWSACFSSQSLSAFRKRRASPYPRVAPPCRATVPVGFHPVGQVSEAIHARSRGSGIPSADAGREGGGEDAESDGHLPAYDVRVQPSSAVEVFVRHLLAFATFLAAVFPSTSHIKPSARLSSYHFHLPPAYTGSETRIMPRDVG
ncbi:hypothetical protein FIBSPDRAFT_496154 [Athelia psychrophila]|uniref:Uncharacterized protein n=1 Tax=Athelia psychrophila TaxID=1759441 RepID=A0A166KKI0_9AGAM|nr:hypothetical protein FIBSPDRAFT_496154 [Fibularhizoctonia sp. CBS 109695]